MDLEVGRGEGQVSCLAEAVELLAEMGRDDREPLLLAALEVLEQAQQAAGLGDGEAALPLVPEQKEASAGGDLVDDGVEHHLSGGVGDLSEAVIEGEASLPAGEATGADDAAAELLAEGIAVGEGVGTLDEFRFGVEGGNRVVVGSERLPSAVESDQGPKAGLLFEVRHRDAVDVLVG